jgi:hypothetical protein
VLDEFAQLTEKSYDEVFLWSIVQLSRTDMRFVKSFWPQVIALDLRYRSAPWKRPAGTRLYEQPYRLMDLVFYFYVIYTLHGINRFGRGGNFSTLALCLAQIAGAWSEPEKKLVITALQELRGEDPDRIAYGDALGYLKTTTMGKV